MKPITLFSWGYYGWGNSTKQLVKAVDAVEESRGFKPPIFVDTRIRRSVRAPGFREAEFEKQLGPDRYRWIKRLGNESIVSKADKMKIADPSAASDLLELAVTASKQKRRIIFFCGCEHAMDGRTLGCHRTAVARLVLKDASNQGLPIEIVEWPGGEPVDLRMPVPPDVFRAVKNGRITIPLRRTLQLGEIAGLPWGSVVSLELGGELLHRLSGPAVYRQGKWCLSVMDWLRGEDFSLQEAKRESAAARKHYGYDPCFSR